MAAKKAFGWRKQDGIRLAVIVWIVACWWIGASRAGIDLQPFLNAAWPDADRFEELEGDSYRVLGSADNVLGYVTTGTASGYGGPLTMAISMTPD